MRIGIGYDVHQFAIDRPLILGGVRIPYAKGLLGHSDADVLAHAIMDALLGALALGDIGMHFPDTSKDYEGADSMILLGKVYRIIQEKGYRIGNIDAIVIAQEPKVIPYITLMREKLAQVLNTQLDQISIKATTEEKLGFTGRLEGIKGEAVVLLLREGEEG